MKYRHMVGSVLSLLCLVTIPTVSFAQASSLSKAVRTSESMEPALARPGQDQAARKKLADLQAKTGKRPNIVWLLVDDMGWGDPGVYGGGSAIGAATPNIDRLAHEGLKLTSAYSQPTCTHARPS